jgi:hypothetical protein
MHVKNIQGKYDHQVNYCDTRSIDKVQDGGKVRLSTSSVLERNSQNTKMSVSSSHQHSNSEKDSGIDLNEQGIPRDRVSQSSSNHKSNVEQQEGSDDELPSHAFSKMAASEELQQSSTLYDIIEISSPCPHEKTVGFVRDSDIGEKEEEEAHHEDVHMTLLQGKSAITSRDNRADMTSFSQGTFGDYDYVDRSSQSLDFDYNFIQPEGEGATENLPPDMIDRSANIPFCELPDFFEILEKELRERKIPLANTKIQSLKNEFDEQNESSNRLSLGEKW